MIVDVLAAQPGVWIAVCGLFGLLIGSFLNVVILRLPVMMENGWRHECAVLLEQAEPEVSRLNLVHPPSHCPSCNAPVRFWQNVPVLSWLMLRGRCAGCQTKISIQYPLVELCAGLLAASVASVWPPSLLMLCICVLTLSLLTLALIDLRTQLLPDSIVLPLLWLGLLVNIDSSFVPLRDAVIGAVAGYMSLWLIFHAFRLVTGKEGMGYGDFKLFAALGAWFGWQALPMIILGASLVGSVVGIGLMASGALKKGMPMPFGPYLAGAGLLVLFFGEPLGALIGLAAV